MNANPASKGEKLRHEIREFIPVALFFLLAFQLLALTQALMLREQGIHISSFVAAAVGALIVAKVVLIADHFSFVHRFPNKPIAYNVLWKTAIYFIGSILVRYTEHVVRFWRQTDSFAAANRRLIDEVIWPHLLIVHLWLLVLLLVYCTINEIVRTLGRERVFDFLFVNRHRWSLHDAGKASSDGWA